MDGIIAFSYWQPKCVLLALVPKAFLNPNQVVWVPEAHLHESALCRWSYRSGILMQQMIGLSAQSQRQSTPSSPGMASRCYSRKAILRQVGLKEFLRCSSFWFLGPSHLLTSMGCHNCRNNVKIRLQHGIPNTKHTLKILGHLSFQITTQEVVLVAACGAKHFFPDVLGDDGSIKGQGRLRM